MKNLFVLKLSTFFPHLHGKGKRVANSKLTCVSHAFLYCVLAISHFWTFSFSRQKLYSLFYCTLKMTAAFWSFSQCKFGTLDSWPYVQGKQMLVLELMPHSVLWFANISTRNYYFRITEVHIFHLVYVLYMLVLDFECFAT